MHETHPLLRDLSGRARWSRVVLALLVLLAPTACIIAAEEPDCPIDASCDECITYSGCGYCGVTGQCVPGTSLGGRGPCQSAWQFVECTLGSTVPDGVVPQSDPPESDPPEGSPRCSDTCTYAGDGDCDDGGAGSDYSMCELGTDCTDCGWR